MAKRVPTNEELQDAVSGVLVEVEGPSPSARNVRKVIETNNPAWRVPAGRRVAKFVKKHEQTTAKSSSTVSSEDDLDDDANSDAPSTPKVQSRRGMLALGASLSVRRLLNGNANAHEPRRELKSKLSFRKKKLKVVGRRPSLTHAPAHDDGKEAEPAPPSPTAVTTPLCMEDKDVPSFISDSDDEQEVAGETVTSDEPNAETPSAVVTKERKSEVVEELAANVVQETPKVVQETPAPAAKETSSDAAKETPSEAVAPSTDVDVQPKAETKNASPEELHAAAALFYHDDNDGTIRKADICGGCVIM